ncbi:MAG: hypothetical protein NXY57DRAFT_494252 [Lentinula lateritia]|uniref:BRCT domain-containing protein n=1 Tax=Lentinula lateritia TaxID=40482 RepID=A0ABQ8VPU0_9AGAR|nr:MAG: hypothetical protein NXY57DRAFT_494252 [Lentinula lateritia]KAJ4498407.1 hypothetical protein C8R41DRAFT_152792 [Lentinula lateritia]
METPTAIPIIPRLRVSRHQQSTVYDYSGSVNLSEAGPSRLPSSTDFLEPNLHAENTDDDEQEQEQDTPKLPSSSALPTDSSSPYPEDTPAARLKAVLERTSARSRPPPAPIPSSGSTTDLESDFDLPTIGSSQPSLARENLNSLFSHALREPGDTPQKSFKGKMRRRNSIDTSEVGSRPRVTKVKDDRSAVEGKRRSLSDDELSSSNTLDRSQAAVFNTLRQRLDSNNQRKQKTQASEQQSAGALDPDESLDTVKFLKDLDDIQSTPPVFTPQHSLKMSVNSRFQSNLMDQDSEMQQAMRDLDSYEHSPTSTPLALEDPLSTNPPLALNNLKFRTCCVLGARQPHPKHPVMQRILVQMGCKAGTLSQTSMIVSTSGIRGIPNLMQQRRAQNTGIPYIALQE